jgi:Ca2+-binding EF-hand superfamily protein
MRNALMMAAATIITAGCASMSLHNPLGTGTFGKIDSNSDGVISQTEAKPYTCITKNFKVMDSNGDGVINPKEYKAATTFLLPLSSFKSYDLSRNGAITHREADAAGGSLKDVYGQVDADGDGNISPAEFKTATINPTKCIAFSQVDTDHDGVIDQKEAKKFPLLDASFDRIDVNHDGFISKDEYKEFRKR